MSEYFYIQSKLNNYVLDITGSNTQPVTPIISYPINSPVSDNQLCQRLPTGQKNFTGGQNQYYIQSKLNDFVLDITGSNTQPATQIISYPINSPASNNQIWEIVESEFEGYFYIKSLLNGYVVDITGSNTAPKTKIISFPQNSPTSDNQLWKFTPLSGSSGHKKSAFA